MLRRLVVAGSTAAATLLLAGTAAAQTGVLAGTIVAANGRAALPGATVTIVGTKLSAVTDKDGRFAITDVPAGDVELRVRRVEYFPVADRVRVAAGDTTRATYALISPNDESETLESVRGRARVTGVGDSVTVSFTVPERRTERSPVIIVDGVIMSPDGSPADMTIEKQPLVIVDGVIMFDASAYMKKMDPNAVEEVEVIKGEAAKDMYGPRAGNGVIRIKTKGAILPPPPPPPAPQPPPQP